MSERSLIVGILAGAPVSTDETQGGAVLARSEITAFDLASLATIASLTNPGALLCSIRLSLSSLVVCCVRAIPLGQG